MSFSTIFAPTQPEQDPISSGLTQMVEQVKFSVVQVLSAGRGSGAGIIWAANGAILTNHHVIANSRPPLRVAFQDGRSLEAEVVASDQTLDLALLQVAAQDLPAAQLGDSSALRVGELVIAVGHPWGLRDVVTAGIISGLGTMGRPDGRRSSQYLRSDVPLAPGNSGGPLLNAQGQVIGINAMIFGGDLSVAIPSHVAREWVAGLTSRPKSGVQLGVGLRPVVIKMDGQSLGQRLRLLEVEPNGLAGRGSLKVGDILLTVSGRPAQSVAALLDILAQHQPGETLQIELLRGGIILKLNLATNQTEQSK